MKLITPDWPAPPHIRAAVTTRADGVGQPPYDSFNLATHVGDDPQAVAENRTRLQNALQLSNAPVWLNQIHSTKIIQLLIENPSNSAEKSNLLNIFKIPDADGAWTDQPNTICVVMTADCLPVLFTNQSGMRVAAVHAGWRGLADGILERGAKIMQQTDEPVFAWIGPAIAQTHYEVGNEMRDIFCAQNTTYAQHFRSSFGSTEKWLADLPGIARQKLESMSVAVYGGNLDTYGDVERFFSYRRDGETGRIATLIWIGSR